MSEDSDRRLALALYAAMGLLVVVSASVAGVGTYALLSDTETDDAGTISVTKKNSAEVRFKGGCTKADIAPSDPNDFDMTVNLADGRSNTFDENDFNPGGDGEFTFDTGKDWPAEKPAPEMANITLDGTTYHCN